MNKQKKESTYSLEKLSKLGELTKKITGPYTKALLIETPNGKYAIHPDDMGVGGELRSNGCYGQSEIKLIKRLINKKSNVLIVGAHVGTIAIPLSQYSNYVAAVEANPNTFELLKINIELNKTNNCEAFNIAASEKFEEISFLLNTANSGGSKRKPLIDHYAYRYDCPKEVVILAAPLDKYLNRTDFNVVVMDIEGSEYFALKGMGEILSNAKALVIEFMPHHFKNVSNISIKEFLSVLPFYTSLTIPKLKKRVNHNEFLDVLEYMYNNNIEEHGIIFEK
ncbi:MAG: FkbM family methyltransferase [Bacteroidota bacterium]